MDKTKWAYLAGLIDGEGCICIYRSYNSKSSCFAYSRGIVVANTDYKVMKWLVEHFGGKIKTGPPRNLERHKRRYGWIPSGTKNLEKITLAILPYMVIKRQQALVFLDFLRIGHSHSHPDRAAQKEKCFLEMRCLNRKGPVETDTQDDNSSMIQSELDGDVKSAPMETSESL